VNGSDGPGTLARVMFHDTMGPVLHARVPAATWREHPASLALGTIAAPHGGDTGQAAVDKADAPLASE
jgi:hypothetical protein